MISVGIPFLNCADTLAHAIRSVFAQSYTDWELILVDDGSTDGSAAIAASIKDERVRVIGDGRTLGLSTRLNQIASLARGVYLARMDGDDLMHPERLAAQLEWFSGPRRCDVLATGACVIGENGTPWGITGLMRLDLNGRSAAWGPHILHPSIMAPAEWFRAHKYDPVFDRAEDRELWCRVASETKFDRIPRPLMYYRVPLRLNLRTQMRGSHFERAIARRYGPALVGKAPTAALLAYSWIKTFAYVTAHGCGMDRALVSRRYARIPQEFAQQASAGLRAIQQTAVPGLDQ